MQEKSNSRRYSSIECVRWEQQRAAQALEWLKMQDRLGRMDREWERANKPIKPKWLYSVIKTTWEVPQQFSNVGVTWLWFGGFLLTHGLLGPLRSNRNNVTVPQFSQSSCNWNQKCTLFNSQLHTYSKEQHGYILLYKKTNLSKYEKEYLRQKQWMEQWFDVMKWQLL